MQLNKWISTFLTAILCIQPAFRAVQAQARQGKPNVIFIYADDLGLGLLSCYGQRIIKTPNIDRLAETGMQFTRAYGAHLCAPARASLITGYSDCRPGKWKVTGGGAYKDLATGQRDLASIEQSVQQANGVEGTQVFLPQVFKKAGYTTAQIGKLEWGFSASTQQLKAHGWDYYYGYLDHEMCHGFYPPFVFENGRVINIPGNTYADAGKSEEPETPAAARNRWNRNGKAVYSEDLFIQKIISFIDTHQHQPFFLYYPSQLPHGPVAIPAIDPEFAFNDSLTGIEKEYASMVKRLDDHVGMILGELARLHLDSNTLIIFSSDNGHEIYYSMKGRVEKPYRDMRTGQLFDNLHTKFYSNIGGDIFNGNASLAGLKRSNWEGGVRVPLIACWPGKIKAGAVSHQLVSNYDLLPTMAQLLGVTVTEEKDGLSYLPALLEQRGSSHNAVTFGSYMGPAVIDSNGWKLRYFAPEKVFQLYYLPDDPGETKDLIQAQPEKTSALKAILTRACEGNLENGWYRE
ncbi:sulfatase-like hydrolase/transferase [Chitinophaga sp. 212800010-3]|uniref:sulfatase-like hydrolase/transferase n=1 Tax=unclassified Chitinophaga TaxID=2619133 RepID=UPI002DEA20E9|nr:Sulfatase, family S1-20 [Chitinophaga sp. 212800010-3]